MKEKTWDVIVVGAGAWGLASAWACATRGADVLVLEAASVASGASGGIVGALSPHVPDQWNPKKQFQFEALARGEKYWREIEDISGVPTGYGRIGRYIPIPDGAAAELAKTRQENALTLWQDQFRWQVLDDSPDLIRADAAPFGVVHETLSARLYPQMAMASLAASCRAKAVRIEENSEVRGIETGRVCTTTQDYVAKSVILAHGVAGLDWLSSQTGRNAGGAVKGQAALLDHDLGGVPQIFADGLYIIPHADGSTAVGSTSENTWENDDTDGLLDDVIARARAIVPTLADAAVVQRWAGFRPKPAKRDPMLGPIPGLEDVYAALGAFKIGFGLVPKIGEVVADFALGDGAELPDSFTVRHHL